MPELFLSFDFPGQEAQLMCDISFENIWTCPLNILGVLRGFIEGLALGYYWPAVRIILPGFHHLKERSLVQKILSSVRISCPPTESVNETPGVPQLDQQFPFPCLQLHKHTTLLHLPLRKHFIWRFLKKLYLTVIWFVTGRFSCFCCTQSLVWF